MTASLGKFLLPFVLAIFAAWRLVGIWTVPEALSLEPLRRPNDPVVKADLPSAMSFHWVRPLFERPVSQKPDNSAKPSEESPAQAPRLVGIIAEGENRIAILESKGRLVRSQTGTMVGSWRIVGIEPRSILLKNGGETKILGLDRK